MAGAVGSAKSRSVARDRRHARVRRRVLGAADRPRLCVFRSHRNIYAQVIDDTADAGVGRTLASACSLEKAVRQTAAEEKGKMALSKAVGLAIAKRATEKGIERVRFDRGGYRFHGRVKALADAAKEGGLVF